jgi:hypothetical protein
MSTKVKGKNDLENIHYVGADFYGSLNNKHGVLTCKKHFANNATYVGDCLNGMFHGYGRYTKKNGEQYAGTFKDGKPHTENGVNGTLKDGKNGLYEGEFQNGLRHGKGKSMSGDGPNKGNLYEGEYENGLRNGHGTYTWNNGSVYIGTWKDNKRHTKPGVPATIVYDNNDVYEGAWENGRRHGPGTYTTSEDKSVFKGRWKNGERQGRGLYVVDGRKFHRKYEKGQVVDEQEVIEE